MFELDEAEAPGQRHLVVEDCENVGEFLIWLCSLTRVCGGEFSLKVAPCGESGRDEKETTSDIQQALKNKAPSMSNIVRLEVLLLGFVCQE